MEQTEEIYDFSILLGKGGFGTVVKAIHRVKKVEVAIKIIPLTALTTLELQRRIENEIYIHKRVHHVNIIQLFEAFIERNQYYLVMECAKEKNLFHYLSLHGRLSEARAVKIIHQLLLALQYLHENRIVHRDVKLSNVLIADVVAQDLVIKLCDFGLAVELTHPDDDHYTYCGTPSYMAPETARQGQGLGHSEAGAGAAVDIWGMGIIFNALLSGSPPSNPTIPHSETVEISSTATSNARDFLRACLSENPKRRPTATVLLAHTLFQQPVTDVSQFTETNTSFTYTTKASSVSLPPPTRHTPVKSSFTPPQRAQRHSSTRLTASTTSLSSSTSSLYLPQHALERGGRGGQVTHSLWQKIKTKTKSLPSFLFFLDNHQTPPSSSSSSGDSSEAIFLTREGDLFLFQRRVKLFLQLGDGTDIVKVGRWGAEEVHRLQHYCNQEEEEEGLRRGSGGGGRNLVLFNHHNYPTSTTSISSLFDLTHYSKTLYCHDLFLAIDEPNTSFNTSFASSSYTSSHHSFKSIAATIQSLLSRALKIIDRITLRIPKLIVYYTSSSSSMKCMFMSNQPLPDFHIQWTDGTRLTYSLQSNHLHILSTSSKLQWRGTLHLTPATGVGSDSSADTMPTQLRHYLHVSQQALLQCMKEERKLNDKSRLSLTSASMSDKRLTGPLVTFIKN